MRTEETTIEVIIALGNADFFCKHPKLEVYEAFKIENGKVSYW